MPTFAGKPSTVSSLVPVEFPQNSMVLDNKDSKHRGCNSTNSLHFPQSYVEDKIQKPNDFV